MIEVTTKWVDDHNFVTNIRLRETDTTWGGIPAHRIWAEHDISTSWLKSLGLHKVGFSYEYNADVYVQGWLPSKLSVMCYTLVRTYWSSLRWLYLYGRIFQPIPIGARFTWSKFTPYVLMRRIIKR